MKISWRKTFSFFLLTSNAFAQLDTNYVQKYNDRLILSLLQNKRSYDLLFTEQITNKNISSSNYIAQANDASGFGIDYDKISFSLSKASPISPREVYKKGTTTYTNLGLAVTGNKWVIETSYRRYKGFYDENTAQYDTSYRNSLPFFQNPNLITSSIRAKVFYFFNKKKRFAYRAAYTNTFRQMKTAGSFMLVSNIYNFRIRADSFLIPPLIQEYYGNWANMNRMNIFSVSLGPGYSCNFVLLKRFFLNLTFTTGLEMQFRNFEFNSGESSRSNVKLSWTAGDIRAAFGFNAKNFLFYFANTVDYNAYNMKQFRIETKFLSSGVHIGYRFPFKEKKWTKWLKENKYYQML